MKPDPNRLPSGEYPDTTAAASAYTIPVVDFSNYSKLTSQNTLLRTERLPFTVRIANKDKDLTRAAQLRRNAYARHVPEFAETLSAPEAADTLDSTTVLLAESKFDGAALATMRIHFNIDEPLPLERSVHLPKKMQHAVLAEATRLALVSGREGHLPRDAMFKAFYLICIFMKIDWMVICARHPIYKTYLGMFFEDAINKNALVPMSHIGGIPHRVLALNINDADSLWRTGKHPLYDFMVQTHHPDIEDFSISCRPLALKILEKRARQKDLALAY